ncbi:MAG: DNA-directed RNA polymerase subunit omega [Ignavibacteria bacterium]|nr:MAG: DNA-directed RNA polymerase subunit omega [Ignavibacteria bacterium]
MSIKPVDFAGLHKHTQNVYEAVVVASKRARMINQDNRLEFNTMINTLIGPAEDEFDDRDNSEQIKISLEFEKRPKPHEIALEELVEGKIKFRYKDEQA